MKHQLIAFVGVLGSGKTTAANILTNHGFTVYEEDFGHNSFLSDYYDDMKRWAFHSQMYFLINKIKQSQKIEKTLVNSHVVQDFPLLQDIAFAKTTRKLGYMTPAEWDLYFDSFLLLNKKFKQPDLIIYLQVSTKNALSRIKKRGREFEQSIETSYIENLQSSIDELIKSVSKKTKCVFYDANKVNLVTNKKDIESFAKEIISYLN